MDPKYPRRLFCFWPPGDGDNIRSPSAIDTCPQPSTRHGGLIAMCYAVLVRAAVVVHDTHFGFHRNALHDYLRGFMEKTFHIESAVFACLVFAGLAIGQTAPKDVEGWGKIKWGMTIAEARAAYEITTQPQANPNGWTTLTLPPIKIANLEMFVDAGARPGTDKISEVNLGLGFDDPGYPSGFDKLKALLIQKYGPPISDETKVAQPHTLDAGHTIRDVLWTFPSASITLKLRPASIAIEYAAIDKKAQDAL